MAHVLLPCDLPFWPDVQHHLAQLATCADAHHMTHVMASLHDLCCVSLDPEEAGGADHPGFPELQRFVEEGMCEAERTRFLGDTLPRMATRAAELKALKPPGGFLYSLRREEGRFELERSLLASLLANAFFSTFTKRNAKTHPTLQDFRMADFFTHLHKRTHQKKLRTFLRYFETLGSAPGGHVKFIRKVVSGPSLPGWLCSDRPLVPLLVREGAYQAEASVYRMCSCSSVIGGDVLKASTSKESRLFFSFPELLVILSFAEGLADGEALVADDISGAQGGVCLLDPSDFSEAPERQFEDRLLLRELNKALAAFTLDKPEKSSQSGAEPSRRTLEKRASSQHSSKLSLRTASQSSARGEDEDFFTADEDSDDGGCGGYTEETSLSRSADSLGFVLGEGEDDEDPLLTPHERLEDFRKRIRKRTRRRLSRRRSSSSSYVGGSSSDMDDILEDPEGGPAHYPLRPASSEPSLRLATPTSPPPKSPLSADAETVLVSMSGRRLMVTSSNGHLKAYSYDGVSPNLPVPFRARFRQRRAPSSFEEDPQPGRPRAAVEADPEGGGDLQLRVSVLWLAASMANLHSLLLYTLNHEQLNEVCKVHGVVVQREWTVGDLSCEVLRFCRNRQRWAATRLFGQILGRTASQDSLD